MALATATGAALVATATVLTAGSAQAATPLSGMQSTPVVGGAYTVQNNEWGTVMPEGTTTDGGADFTVANSSISSVLAGYPSIYAGCHWGNCTRGGLAANPVRVSTLTNPGTVTTSWNTTQPAGSTSYLYNAAYDLWLNQTPATTGQPNGAELMVWLNHRGPVHAFGSPVGTAAINDVWYQVWEGRRPWGNTITYVMAVPATSVRNLDVGALAADAVRRGYIQTSWYLIDVEAGFELWRGGAGLATDSFSVHLSSDRGTPASTPARTPASTPPLAPKPAPSPANTSSGISLQAISHTPTTPGSATDVTVDFENTGSTVASNATLVIEVLNSAGTVVGSQSWTGQTIALRQSVIETYTWTAASSAGNYTVEGLVRDSSGKALQHAQVGTITVNRRPRADH